MKSKLLLLCLAALTCNCQNKSKDLRCTELFKKYKEKFSTKEVDSTRYFIESAMKCAPDDKGFINNSIQFYIKIKDYKAAIRQVEKLQGTGYNKSLYFMISVLKLKDGFPNSNSNLKKLYKEYRDDKRLTSTDIIYKIALDNYFNKTDYALAQIKEYRKSYNSEYDIQNLDAVESLIKTLHKDEVLFSLFNIKS